MKHTWYKGLWILLLLFIVKADTYAQEGIAPINFNPVVNHAAKQHLVAAKKTGLSLPFFEDFTGASPYPDATKWVDNEVYINNTMGVHPISRGVATMDALNQYGLPYDTTNNYNFERADSLTSQPIDLSTNVPGDSIYLSFFYQPAGNGFYPLTQDTLFLYMRKKNGDWVINWMVQGSLLQPFQQVMIPVSDTNYLYDNFQFRFVNIAAFNYADAVWNIDYVRMDKNRNMYDTAINNIGFTTDPTFLLNDYTYMPYRQFLANANGERATQFMDSVRNNYGTSQGITYGLTTREAITNTPLYTAPLNNSVVLAGQSQELTYATYINTVSAAPDAALDFENKFYIQSIPGDPTDNDTIVRHQIFDNYVAYDDGTAEKSYFLNLFPSLPGYIEVEYHLNQPDTMRGMAIYFGRQVPLARQKFFSIAVYSSLAGVDGGTSDNLLKQQDLYTPSYVDEVNHFWYYTFDQPLVLPAGTFFAGTIQPANSGSDSLYIGLDVNRVGGNHVYYNVLSQWEPSQISGALMMRPLLGQVTHSSNVGDVAPQTENWLAYPNPASNYVQFSVADGKKAVYSITDISGRTLMNGQIANGDKVNISRLSAGMYFVNLSFNGVAGTPQKLIKQ